MFCFFVAVLFFAFFQFLLALRKWKHDQYYRYPLKDIKVLFIIIDSYYYVYVSAKKYSFIVQIWSVTFGKILFNSNARGFAPISFFDGRKT